LVNIKIKNLSGWFP